MSSVIAALLPWIAEHGASTSAPQSILANEEHGTSFLDPNPSPNSSEHGTRLSDSKGSNDLEFGTSLPDALPCLTEPEHSDLFSVSSSVPAYLGCGTVSSSDSLHSSFTVEPDAPSSNSTSSPPPQNSNEDGPLIALQTCKYDFYELSTTNSRDTQCY